MDLDGVKVFTVTVTGREVVVAAALPMQEHWLPLSNLDLLLPPIDVGVFFCYINDGTSTFFDKVRTLKEALAEVLVPFYAFAGEVAVNLAGEPEIVCNNQGVEFCEAECLNMELRELHLYDPHSSVEGKLVPTKNIGVLCVQATKFKCGGMVVGCTFDHRVADAYSANMFLVAWAATATSSATNTPLFRRSLLNPRRPLSSIDPSIDRLYVPYSSLPAPSSDIKTTTMISRIYHLDTTQISALQTLATKSTNQKPPSKLQTLSAYLWKLVAQCDTVLEKSTCKLGIVVDGRRHIGPTMDSYFGNVISIPFARLGVGELKKLPLADVAETVGQIVATTANKEHFMNLVDWVEAHRPELVVAKAYVDRSEFEPGFVVSSGQRFPVTEVDFGWGKPVFGSYHFPWGGSTGYVMPMSSPNENGDLIVYMHLLESQLNFIEEKASHVFKPFSLEFVKAFSY